MRLLNHLPFLFAIFIAVSLAEEATQTPDTDDTARKIVKPPRPIRQTFNGARIFDKTVTEKKINSGTTSTNSLLASDGTGGATWISPASLLGSPEATYVLKAGDTMTGPLLLNGDPVDPLGAATKQFADAETVRAGAAEASLLGNVSSRVAKAGDTMTGELQINAPNTALTLTSASAVQGALVVGANPPLNGLISVGTTQNSVNISVKDQNPSMLFSDTGTGNTAGFIQFRDTDQLTVRAQIAAFSPNHATRPNWFNIFNFKFAPLVLGTNAVERMRIDETGKVGVNTPAPNSALHVNGSLSLPVRSTGSDANINASDYTYIMTGTLLSSQLPTAVGIQGRIYVIKNRTGTTATVFAATGEKIDDATFASMTANQVVIVQSDGANWIKIN